MMKRTGLYPRVQPDTTGPRSGRRPWPVRWARPCARGWTSELSSALSPWRKETARHDLGKVFADLLIDLSLGGDCHIVGEHDYRAPTARTIL